MNDTKKFTFSEDVNGLPTLQELQSWSFQTSLQRSTNKLTVTDEIIQIVKADALAYYDKLADDTTINNYVSRIKSSDSIELKSQRYPDLRFQSVFNDILGIRIHCSEYPVFIPDYYRIVDLRKGKADDDGYRGIHLYYKQDNFHYVIEVQLWADPDYAFNIWTHSDTYKYENPKVTLELRKLYDCGIIKNYNDFRKELNKYE